MSAKRTRPDPYSFVFGLAALLGAGVLAWLMFVPRDAASVAPPIPLEDATLPQLLASMQAGDYARAAAIAEMLRQNPDMSEEEKALVAYHAIGARFRATGDVNMLLADVQDLKHGLLASGVSKETRARLMASLAGIYFLNGTIRPVADEIYKDEPFSSYWRGTNFSSAHALFEESVAISPTAYAEVGIAHWYAKVSAYDGQLPPADREAYHRRAAEHLASAEALYAQERKAAGAEDVAEHIRYRAMRAGTYGLLTIQGVEPYASEYPAVFEEYIRDAEAGGHALAKELLLYVRFRYAHSLEHDGDIVAAKAQLDRIATDLSMLPNPDIHMFVLLTRNENAFAPLGAFWTTVEGRLPISPAFSAAVDHVLNPDGR